jgi:ADP-ribose pyrophosphatase
VSEPVAASGANADTELRDVPHQDPVLHREVTHHGMVWDVVRERFDHGGEELTREFVEHSGAVAVVVLDEAGRVLLLRQYRHPARVLEWELPAGLLDVPGEDPLVAAQRELAEEADLVAAEWSHLATHRSSPGFTDEVLTTYLATGVTEVPEAERHERTGEERDMELRWVPLPEAVDAVLDSRIGNATTMIGLLTAFARHRA